MKDQQTHFAAQRSHRQLKVGEEIRHIVSSLFARGELADPALFGKSLTITEVKISPDLKNATIFYVPLLAVNFDAEGLVVIQKGLEKVEPFIKRHIAASLKIRVTPKLKFSYDRTFDNIDAVGKLLSHPRVQADLTPPTK